ncbi:hypothetical protein NNJEOMEG_00334 [Fundidesulfovibrio magnetotacticus]|uniref:Dynamin N-terminal domain-containing protein n=1 Tax=Fundidesulfovibrio magnetotacticus TaxID=2730080 RepID=A0A6V8LQV3_9BACT|nr:dynamin family protein [Fundidesulfovibrio magnetotacticus]GFK92509.1 hypothetical protein NNJEOMEG_00334 [Fundidesulfovibrio magnetotacticus]
MTQAGPHLLDPSLAQARAGVAGLLEKLEALAARRAGESLARDAASLRQAAGEPFLFVAAGEVKAGKSSFINALLGEQVSDVAPDPCTDRILMIAHGPGRSRTDEGPLSARVELPHPILHGVAVVDTPGIDSVVDRHQEITERFIPRCDQVFYALSSLNPYSRASWDFLGLVASRWRRKVALVLTQADLATPGQLQVNRQRVLELARERGLEGAPLFVVSAALEAVQPELSGMEAVRRHIREMVTGGEHARAKLASLARGGLAVLEGVEAAGLAVAQSVEADREAALAMRERIRQTRAAARLEVEALAGRIRQRFERTGQGYLAALELELSFASMFRRSVLGFFRRSSAVPSLLEGLERTFRESLETQVESQAREGAAALSQRLALDVAALARDLRALAGQDPAGNTPPGARREEVLADVARALDAFLDAGDDPVRVDPLRVARMDPRAAMGGIMVLAGSLFVLSVQGVALDVTGGLLAGTGAALAGSVLAVGRPRLLRSLRESLARGARRVEEEVLRLVGARTDQAADALEEVLSPFEADVAARQAALDEAASECAALRSGFAQALDTAGRTA